MTLKLKDIKITDIKVKALAAVMAFIFILIAIMYIQSLLSPSNVPLLGDIHTHADFKVYVNGQALNFTQEKYMSSSTGSLSRFVHLHDMEGDVIHFHISSADLWMFFKSLNMTFNSTCLALDSGASYCNSAEGTLKMFVNGVPSDKFDKFKPNDLDRILITYGNESPAEIQSQISNVTDKACIQSLKCPERGVPHDESTCVVGEDCKV